MTPSPRPGLSEIFLTFFTLGIQSFGGGSSTFYLIHKTCTKRGWMSAEEIVRTWALSQISPGINLVKLTALIGYRLRGWPGLVAAMAGLLIPSGAMTALMTAGFSAIRTQPLVQTAMRGILPATIGLSVAMAVRMAQPLVAQARQEGRLRLSAHLVIMAAAAVLMAAGQISPVIVLLLAGVITLLLMMAAPAGSPPPPPPANGP